MIINGKEYSVEDMVNALNISKNNYIKVGNLMLTKREIEILERNKINYESCKTINDIIIQVQHLIDESELEEADLDELDWLLDQLSERNYYMNTNK